MVATANRYIPLLVSEKLAPPLTLCRAACAGMAVMIMSLGQSCTNRNGRLWGNERIKQALKQARKNTGEPLRKGYNQSHLPAFLKAFDSIQMEPKQYIYNKSRLKIREALQKGQVITLAGDVARTPLDSKLRLYVRGGVGHEIIFFDWEGGDRRGTVAYIDPMTPPYVNAYVKRVPVSDMFAFGSAYKHAGGKFIAERWRPGWQTQESQVARNRAKVILDLQTRLLEVIEKWKDADREVDDLIVKYNKLQKAYREDIKDALQAIEEAESLLRTAEEALKRTA